MLRNRSRRNVDTSLTDTKSGGGLEAVQVDPFLLTNFMNVGPQNRYRHTIQFCEDFDDSTTYAQTYGTSVDDVINYTSSTKSAKITKTTTEQSSCQITKTLSSDADMSGCNFVLRFYVHDGIGSSLWSKISSVQIRLGNDGWSTYLTLPFISFLRPGWNQITIGPSQGTATGTPDMSAIKYIRLLIYTVGDNTATPSITFDTFYAIKQYNKGLYCATFDDGTSDHYDMAAYMASNGLVGTFFVVPSLVGTTNYLTLNQLRKMKLMGHLIANHTYNHNYPVTGGTITETKDDAIEDIRKASEWLCANGFGEGARVLALPGGLSNWNEALMAWSLRDELCGKYVDLIRTTGEIKSLTAYDSEIIRASCFDSKNDADLCLTKIVEDKSLAIVGWHKPGTGFTIEEFKTHIDSVTSQAHSGLVKVLLMSDLLNLQVFGV